MKKQLRSTSSIKPWPVFTGCPNYFRAACFHASQGGSHAYRHAGFTLGAATEGEQPYEAENAEWDESLRVLIDRLTADDRAGVVAWYERTYPVCMALVPARRRASFVEGVFDAFNDGRMPTRV